MLLQAAYTHGEASKISTSTQTAAEMSAHTTMVIPVYDAFN